MSKTCLLLSDMPNVYRNTSLNAALLGQKCKPETRGFCGLPNPAFGFGKMSGFPRAPGFSKPGFQSLTIVHRAVLLFMLKINTLFAALQLWYYD